MSGLFGLGLQKHEHVWLHRFGSREWVTDCDGRLIKRSDYGKETQYAWEIDHIVPSAVGGSDELHNLRPRHCRGNALAGALLGNALSSLRETPPRRGLINSLADPTPRKGLF